MIAIDGQFWEHGLAVTQDRVRIEFLPPRCTMKNQPHDFSLIAVVEICCRSKLLSAVLEVTEIKRNANHIFKERSMNGYFGLQDGLLLHFGDAIMLFDSDWVVISR